MQNKDCYSVSVSCLYRKRWLHRMHQFCRQFDNNFDNLSPFLPFFLSPSLPHPPSLPPYTYIPASLPAVVSFIGVLRMLPVLQRLDDAYSF